MSRSFNPKFTITNRITAGLTRIERARGFLEAATLSDFKRLFTISEYYDRDRPAFYRAIQSVRASGMEMTGWLEYFVEGLTTQLTEVRERGEQAIRRDVLVKEHGLSDRQARALGHILEQGSLTIQDLERLYPDVNRRSLQRDLKAMVDMGLLVSEGATNKLVYRIRETG
jgi:Fic family protein